MPQLTNTGGSILVGSYKLKKISCPQDFNSVLLYGIVFYLTQSHCFRAILRVQVVMGEGSYSQYTP